MNLLLVVLSFIAIFMTETVDKIISTTINHEGGWSNHLNDRGGKTNWGITLRTLQAFRPGSTEDTLRRMTAAEARDFYKEFFFYGMGADKAPANIQDIIFDMNVNHGAANSTRILQKSISELGIKTSIDGVIGPKTIAAADKVKDRLRAQLILNRIEFYNNIVARDKTQAVFLHGWAKRALYYKTENQNG